LNQKQLWSLDRAKGWARGSLWSWPVAGATWLLVYQQQKDPAKGKKLVEFLKWAMAKGGGMAKSLDYAPLPETVQQRVLKRIDEIKY